MIAIDFDNYRNRLDELGEFLDIVGSCWIRFSAGGEGLHIKAEGKCDYESEVYRRFDDPKRLIANRVRKECGQVHNVLWDSKNGRKVGSWIEVSGCVPVETDRLNE